MRPHDALRRRQRLTDPEWLAFNLVRDLQQATTAERRPPTRKRRTNFRFETIYTLRYRCFGRAGVLVYPEGYATLDVGPAPAVADRSKCLDRLLKAAKYLSH